MERMKHFNPIARAERYRAEIEKAIDNAKRDAHDKWWRKQWYRAAGLRRRRELGLPMRRKSGNAEKDSILPARTLRRAARMRLEVKKMTEEEEAELAEIITKLIENNGKVRSAVMNAACCSPNIVTQY